MSSSPCFMFDRVPLLLKLIVFVCFSLALGAAQAQNISNGRALYLNGPPSLGGIACSNSGCHGPNPSNNANSILSAANNPGAISAMIEQPGRSGMGVFRGVLTANDLADIAAFIANPNSTVPGAPIVGTATAGNAAATVTFSAPATNGGSAITGYTVTSSPAGGVDSNAGSTALTHSVTGLVNGTAYTFVVTATNAIGTSVASAGSSATSRTND